MKTAKKLVLLFIMIAFSAVLIVIFSAVPAYAETVSASALDVTGYYGADNSYSISVNTDSSATIVYGYGDTVNYDCGTNNPSFTNFGIYKVYFKVSLSGYEDYVGSATITVKLLVQTPEAANANLTYDGTQQTPAYPEDSVLYTYSGTLYATDAGDYTVYVTLNQSYYEWEDPYTSLSRPLYWTIKKANPEISIDDLSKTYDGKAVASNGFYTTTGDGEVSVKFTKDGNNYDAPVFAGEYTVTVSTKGTTNYNAKSQSRNFKISKKDGEVKFLKKLDKIYSGTAVSTTGLYSFSGDGVDTLTFYDDTYAALDSAPKNAGKYTAVVTVAEGSNYYAFSGSLDFTISKAQVIKPSVTATNLVYDGFQKNAGIASDSRYTVEMDTAVSAGKHMAVVYLNDQVNYEWSDGTTESLELIWIIAKAQVVKPSAPSVISFTYNGYTYFSLLIDESEFYSIAGNSYRDSGEYAAVISLNNVLDYEWTDGTSAAVVFNWNIKKAETYINITEDLTKVYDGASVTAPAYDTNYDVGVFFKFYNNKGEEIGYAPNESGTYSVMAIVPETDNFEGSSATRTFEITRPTYNMDYVAFRNICVTYDGKCHSIEVSGGVPDGVTVTYIGNNKTEPGVYTVTAKFTGNSNYNVIADMTATITILAVEIVSNDGKSLLINRFGFVSNNDLSIQTVNSAVKIKVTEKAVKEMFGRQTELYSLYAVQTDQPFPDGITLKLALPEIADNQYVEVLRTYADGHTQIVNFDVEDDYAVLTPTSDGVYGLVVITRTNYNWIWFAGSAVVLLGVIIIFNFVIKTKPPKAPEYVAPQNGEK